MPLDNPAPMLTGVKVVDLSSVVFGPYATQVLADYGAEVIKVEPTIGDAARHTAKCAKTAGMSPMHMTLNRGKKSVALDLKDPDDADIMRKLIGETDIFVHNIRDEAIQRLGLGYDDVKAFNPGIIYVHCVGFGSDGPYANLPAYDDVIQAAVGAPSLACRVDGDPRPRYIPSLIADKVAGLNAVYATMAAVIHKLRTGRGQFVEVPMFESFAHFMLKDHLAGKTFDPPSGPLLYSRQVDPDRQPFPTKDGYIALVPYMDSDWITLFDAFGASELLSKEPLDTPEGRRANVPLLYQEIARHTPAQTTGHWVTTLRQSGVICMPSRDIDDILDDPHLATTGFFERREHPTEGPIYEMSDASRFSDWQTPPQEGAPLLGQHTEEEKRRLRGD